MFLIFLLSSILSIIILLIFLKTTMFFRDIFKKKPVSKYTKRTVIDEGSCIVKLISVPEGRRIDAIRLLRKYFEIDLSVAIQKIETGVFPIVISYDMPVYKAEEFQEECEWVDIVVEIYKI